jgi:hypothetical protein
LKLKAPTVGSAKTDLIDEVVIDPLPLMVYKAIYTSKKIEWNIIEA